MNNLSWISKHPSICHSNIDAFQYARDVSTRTFHRKDEETIFTLPDGLYRIEREGLIEDVNIVSGKKNGDGIIRTPNGSTYFVSFKDNIPQGSAFRIDSNGNALFYRVLNGSPKGDALEILNNGREVCFSFGENGLKHGKAIETNWYGEIEYTYINGVRQFPAKIIGKDGKKYFLHFYKEKPNGAAKVFLPNDTIIYCNYVNGYPEGEARMVLSRDHEIVYTYVKGVAQGVATEIFLKGSAKFSVVDGTRMYPIFFYNNHEVQIARAQTQQELTLLAQKFEATNNEKILAESLYIDGWIPIQNPTSTLADLVIIKIESKSTSSTTNSEARSNESSSKKTDLYLFQKQSSTISDYNEDNNETEIIEELFGVNVQPNSDFGIVTSREGLMELEQTQKESPAQPTLGDDHNGSMQEDSSSLKDNDWKNSVWF